MNKTAVLGFFTNPVSFHYRFSPPSDRPNPSATPPFFRGPPGTGVLSLPMRLAIVFGLLLSGGVDGIAAENCSQTNFCTNWHYECVDGYCRCPEDTNSGTVYEICEDQEVCIPGEGCLDYQTDSRHCGGAFQACSAGEICVDGSCKCGFRVLGVEIWETCGEFEGCSPTEGCIDLRSDPRHCGAIGNGCEATETCVSGLCVCSTEAGQLETCEPNENCNPGKGCKDLQTDPQHCGYLNLTCGPGEQCTDGRCSCGQTTAPSGSGSAACGDSQACCGSPGQCVPEQECACGTVLCADGQVCCTDAATGTQSCVPTSRDEDNCGSCGNCCGSGQDCRGGFCACESGMADCDSDLNNGCESDLSTDSRNCGSCGLQCEAGERCVDGQCALTCQPGLTSCDGQCTDLQWDTYNCGACGVACPSGEICNGVGTCDLSCQPGLTECDGQCTDLQWDTYNCGACGVACPSGEICNGVGTCELSCQPGLTECGGMCRDFNSDRNHCGGCNVPCGLGEVCDGSGQCILSCQGELTDCGGVCRDLSIDPRHCGTCDNECLAGEICVSGGCSPVGISSFDAAPDLFIPYWSTQDEETLLVVSSTQDAVIQATFFDDRQGAWISDEGFNLVANELLTVKLSELGLTGQGSIVVRSKTANGYAPNIAAEAIVRGDKKDELYSFSPANALKGVWTTFAPTWQGSYGSLEYDELIIFSPGRELARALDNLGILPGRPYNMYPDEVVVTLFDDLGYELTKVTVPLESVTRIELSKLANVKHPGPGSLRIEPVLVPPDDGLPGHVSPPLHPVPEDVVFIAYLKRHLDNEIKIGKEAVKSGYLFSETPEIKR